MLQSQEAIDGSFPFQDDPEKKYAIYVPSNYDESNANSLMVGLHPLNINRWNAVSWRDTLIQFAEMNDLLLICPDGGDDGKIDDPIDTAFTSLIIDSMEIWYNIDPSKKYLMGFSWGGKTTYTYGLRRINQFAGFMPIGAAISGIAEIEDVINQAQNKSFFVIHGSNDSPNARYFPIIAGLEEQGACVLTNYLNGVGHTIDFEDRDIILTEAYEQLANSNCGMTATATIEDKAEISVFATSDPLKFRIESEDAWQLLHIIGKDGKRVDFKLDGSIVELNSSVRGMILFAFQQEGTIISKKLILF